ncbi:MAG: flavodoxin-dependent (E)-4-hydroxy-3-methylbut-2-enyl-diphosphate synthase [Treponema sp.]|nr:flavodoxin-dependent (E)-4-hydroxy-3-methylbut-2-enyl-diphosphate synthase [Treponema sp.]
MSRIVKIGGFSHVDCVQIGGDLPIVIQTMWKDRLSFSNIDEAAAQIASLKSLGCDLLRFAVPDIQNAEVLGHLAQMVSMPLAADIHFDYKIALRCLDFPIAKIRINPGNIGSKDKVEAVLGKAASGGIPIRIGVNAGSLPQDLRLKVEEGMAPSAALVEAAEREISLFKEFNFDNFLVSMKASTIADTIIANRLLSGRCDAPLHAGVTEAGPLTAGVVRNTAALVTLLAEGIGDTIRVSLSDTMENEIIAAREIVMAASELGCKRRKGGVRIVSCPRCGRHGFDTHGFTERWMRRLYAMDKNITAAIMGCEVNGPVEAKHADIGITGAGDKILIFKHGKVIRTITPDQADKIFEEELMKL